MERAIGKYNRRKEARVQRVVVVESSFFTFNKNELIRFVDVMCMLNGREWVRSSTSTPSLLRKFNSSGSYTKEFVFSVD